MILDKEVLTKMVFSVTKEDIEKGVRGKPKYCPIANSLNKLDLKCEHGERVTILVVPPEIWFASNSCIECSMHPSFKLFFDNTEGVIQKIFHYDSSGEMEPFGFKLL